MTREEAIAYGNRVIDLGLNDETQAFCELAVKALEQEPCEDCISRQAALDMATSYITDGWDMYTPLVVDVEDIEELPSVTPAPKMGRWIPVSVIEDIKADIKSEYVSLRHRTDEAIELGECMGLRIALAIIDRHTVAKMEGVEE